MLVFYLFVVIVAAAAAGVYFHCFCSFLFSIFFTLLLLLPLLILKDAFCAFLRLLGYVNDTYKTNNNKGRAQEMSHGSSNNNKAAGGVKEEGCAS